MTKEFNLSEERMFDHSTTENDVVVTKYKYPEAKVKEFMKQMEEWCKLHEDTLITGGTVWQVIKDKAGEKLI